MDNQEAFNKVVRHLLTQNEKSASMSESGHVICYYRHPTKNLRCAIGALIPDEFYTSKMEGQSVILLEEYFFDPRGTELFKGVSKALLVALQKIHDILSPERWKEELIQVAKRYNLRFPQEFLPWTTKKPSTSPSNTSSPKTKKP